MSVDDPTEETATRSRIVRIPTDVNRPDPILAGLTGRQLLVLAVIAAACYAGYSATRAMVPPLAAAAAGTVIVGVAFGVVTVRRDGVGVDRLAAAGVRYLWAPRRLVPEPGRPVPPWAGLRSQPSLGRLRLPVSHIDAGGVLDLGADGAAVVCAASTVNLGLRTPVEQDALAGAYGGWLNSLTGPVQILVRADQLDLHPMIAELELAAADLPDPGLEEAALDHARFLRELAADSDLLRRQILLVIREPLPPALGHRTGAGPALRAAARTRTGQRAAETTAALSAAGIAVTVLDGPAAAAVLAAAADPGRPSPASGLAPPDASITGLDPLSDPVLEVTR
jgi:hypothetical protein